MVEVVKTFEHLTEEFFDLGGWEGEVRVGENSSEIMIHVLEYHVYERYSSIYAPFKEEDVGHTLFKHHFL